MPQGVQVDISQRCKFRAESLHYLIKSFKNYKMLPFLQALFLTVSTFWEQWRRTTVRKILWLNHSFYLPNLSLSTQVWRLQRDVLGLQTTGPGSGLCLLPAQIKAARTGVSRRELTSMSVIPALPRPALCVACWVTKAEEKGSRCLKCHLSKAQTVTHTDALFHNGTKAPTCPLFFFFFETGSLIDDSVNTHDESMNKVHGAAVLCWRVRWPGCGCAQMHLSWCNRRSVCVCGRRCVWRV